MKTSNVDTVFTIELPIMHFYFFFKWNMLNACLIVKINFASPCFRFSYTYLLKFSIILEFCNFILLIFCNMDSWPSVFSDVIISYSVTTCFVFNLPKILHFCCGSWFIAFRSPKIRLRSMNYPIFIQFFIESSYVRRHRFFLCVNPVNYFHV